MGKEKWGGTEVLEGKGSKGAGVGGAAAWVLSLKGELREEVDCEQTSEEVNPAEEVSPAEEVGPGEEVGPAEAVGPPGTTPGSSLVSQTAEAASASEKNRINRRATISCQHLSGVPKVPSSPSSPGPGRRRKPRRAGPEPAPPSSHRPAPPHPPPAELTPARGRSERRAAAAQSAEEPPPASRPAPSASRAAAMASEELARKLQRQLRRSARVRAAIAAAELRSQLNRPLDIQEGAARPRRYRVFNPYTEFPEFSRRLIKDLESMFKRYDAGQDGYIDLMELKLMMEKLGAPQTHLGLKGMIREVDEDFDGKLSFREFLLIFHKARAGKLEADSGLMALAKLSEINVAQQGVRGAKVFFEAKVQALSSASRFEAELKAEQEQRKREEQERQLRRAAFRELKATFSRT
ncbi:PREDICTED: EF-hand domain-containing protein D1 [Elephantulus edwardii]|uniref:EF-hand domain-containing protein D1 n=1 Tax=Elephantulus edwardii TaxID=28737 RepID=UPI0003F08A9B|nr:PREDICTED: EF-hand domain-containing protein D1 [Elephantulus edwardii]